MQTDIHIEVVSRYIIAPVTQEGLSIFMITVSNIIIIIIIIMLTFIMRLLLQNKNIGAVQKYK